MSENTPEPQRRFVRITEGGQREEYDFAPFPTGPQQDAGMPQMMILPLSEIIGDGADGELRHLAYDDPPHNMTADEWKTTLHDGARKAENAEHFARSLTHAILKDLVISHGCHPDVAIPAIIEFADKVYTEVTGTV